MSAARPTESSTIKYNTKVVEATVGAWLPRQVSIVDGARSRAQSAYAIASALAGVLVGAGLLTTLDKRPTVVKVVGVVALVSWLISATFYLRAVASPLKAKDPGVGPVSGRQFVDTVLDDAQAEREEVDRRLKLANGSSFVALSLTALSVALALFVTSVSRERVTLLLTDEGAAAIAKVCPRAPAALAGDAETDTLASDIVRVRVDPGVCDGVRLTLMVPRSSIAAVRAD